MHNPARTCLIVALLVALAGCSRVGLQTNAHVPAGHTPPDVLRIAVMQDVKSLNPLLASTTVDGFVDRLMFEPLLSADERGRPVPMLATAVPATSNGGISPNGRTITYHLRRDVRWSDGQPVTSRDVRWSWQAIMNPANDVVSRHGYDVIRSIETPNDRTVIVRLKVPFAPFVNTFFAESDQPYSIAPAHVLAQYSDINHVPFDAAPTVTDGPFRFVEWVHGDHLTLVADPHFFLGAPKLARIELSIIPDENTTVQLLRTRSIDYMFQASIDTNRELKDIPGLRIVWNDMNGYQGMGMNLNHAPLNDVRVRLAIAAALDRERIVKTLTGGQVRPATEDLPDWMWAYNPDARPPAFDPARARALLRSAGYVPRADGIVARNGVPLRLELVTEVADTTHRKLVQLVQAMLRDIGVAVDIKLFPADLLYAPQAMGGIMHGGKFDLIVLPWYSGIDPDDSSQFMCANVPPNGYNDTHYCSPEMEQAQRRALRFYDERDRRAAYFSIQKLLARDNPIVFLWWQRQQEPISVDFKGFAPNPTVESWNAWRWSKSH
ncbi:MAG: peptide ABC transporter substrate-binding protein [Candidatus Eremiobacteraeota bacterium]|nr:peptide ABC transporter substrate-binding protein [Candidatus Eremiobacteraeota bacterium]